MFFSCVSRALSDFSLVNMEAEEFGDAGASSLTPIACGAIKKSQYIMMKGRPCKIVDASSSKTGKHGSAKVNYVGIDIFSGKRYEECHPSSHSVYIPVVERTECSLVDIDSDGYLHLMLPDYTMREDIRDENILPAIKEMFSKRKPEEDILVRTGFLLLTVLSLGQSHQLR